MVDALGSEAAPLHRPVMGREVVELLDPVAGDTLLDLTVGTGGHALLVGAHLGSSGLVAGMDADREALEQARPRLEGALACRVRLFNGWFAEADEVLEQVGVEGFDLVLADLGVGTHQLDRPERGFSFESDRMLDMRFDPAAGRGAAQVLNEESEEGLADIFFHLGQERFSRRIASEVCRRRRGGAVESARELADIAVRVYAARSGRRRWRKHPATRIFMALRIYVNAELDQLDRLLALLPRIVACDARVAIITYHSLEAARVKAAWRRQAVAGLLQPVTAKPLRPSDREVGDNPRARSAQLRVARFVRTDTGSTHG